MPAATPAVSVAPATGSPGSTPAASAANACLLQPRNLLRSELESRSNNVRLFPAADRERVTAEIAVAATL